MTWVGELMQYGHAKVLVRPPGWFIASTRATIMHIIFFLKSAIGAQPTTLTVKSVPNLLVKALKMTQRPSNYLEFTLAHRLVHMYPTLC
jgi:hypothetical protein